MSDDGRRVRVGPVDELDHDDRRVVETDVGEVVVINFEGELYALSNTCLHDRGPICRGSAHGSLEVEVTEPGERDREYFSDRPAIACPWHGWEYYMDTGEHVGDDDVVLPTYDVTVEDGDVFVELR